MDEKHYIDLSSHEEEVICDCVQLMNTITHRNNGINDWMPLNPGRI